MANPAPTINQINAFNATQGTTIDFNIIGGTELVRSNRIYIYDLSDNSLICTHLYVSTESIHELPPNTDGSIVYESGKSSADFVNGAQYYAQIQTFTDIGGTEGGSGLSVAKMFWCLDDPTLTIDTIPSTISTTSYNVSATYDANTSVVSNIIQQYQFSLYSATGSLLQSSGVVVGNGEQQGTSTAYDISYNFTGLSVGSSYYVVVDVTTTQGMSISTQSGTFTVSIDTPTLGEATVVNNACDGYISVTSNLSSEYGGSGSGDIVSFETDSENVFSKLQVTLSPTQSGSGTASPDNVRPIYGVGGIDVENTGKNLLDNNGIELTASSLLYARSEGHGVPIKLKANTAYTFSNNADSIASGVYIHEPYSGTIISVLYNAKSITYTPTEDVEVGVTFYWANGRPNNATNIQLELGSTATVYESYQGQTVSEQFDVSLTPTSKDTDPYVFKAVGDIYGDRLEEDLVGATVNWNQIFTWIATGTFNGVTISGTAEKNTLNGTATATIYRPMSGTYKSIIGHVYFVSQGTANSGVELYNDSGGVSTLFNIASVGKATAEKSFYVRVANGTVLNSADFTFQIIDLTKMFGSTIADYVYSLESGTAGAGVAWLKARGFFTKPYYEYDTGTLKSVEATAHVTRGVNAWDEEWELGYLIPSNGQNATSQSDFRSKNYIPVVPNATYYILCPYTGTNRYALYDADKNFITSSNGWGVFSTKTVTMPSNAHYMRFYCTGTTYNNDICINISNPTINGKYFPYEEHTYDLGNVPLYGLFQLENGKLKAYGDVRHADGGTDRKFGLVTFDSSSWTLYDQNATNIRFAIAKTIPLGKANSANVIFTGGGTWSVGDTAVGTDTNKLDIRASIIVVSIAKSIFTGTTGAEFGTYMNGKQFVYELATPTTETTDPFTQIQEVSKYGTLEYITTNGIPVGHNTTYLTRDIFGGYIDLVSGQLVVTHTSIDLGTVTFGKSSTVTGGFTGTLTTRYPNVNDNQMLCSTYDFDGFGNANRGYYGADNTIRYYYSGSPITNCEIYIHDTSKASLNATQFKEALNGEQLLIPLETPLTYQLTPQQIQTLVGVNNVWSEQGDIELSYHIPITNLLVKRQDVDDVSGNWLTLYSQPIEQASDMDFTFIDFLNQYGKTYKYALVPLLTQTQSGVEVEVEGGYTVSDEVQSIFDGVFISDSTGSQKCKANVGYGNVNMNQSVGSITPIGSQYPIIVTNSNNRYHNGSISGMIVPDDYYYNGNLSRIDMVNKRNELEQFLTNKRAKIIKDWNSNIWLVMIMDNIDCSFDNNYGMGIVTFNANWLEIGDPTNQEDLQATGLVDVGGV